MKKIVCTILVIMMLISVLEQPQVLAKENEQIYSKSGENMLNYLNGYDDNLLIYRKNYGYMNAVENFESSAISLYFREMSGIFAETETKPDKEKYMETLINIIATYDLDNATDITAQKNMDNLKDIKDYAMDFVEMGKEAISAMTGLSSASGKLEEGISMAISGIAVLAKNTNNWLDALSDLETIIHNYVKYDNFFKMIEDNSNGDLKEAAISLRKAMSKAIEIKLETYNNVSDENFGNYGEFFFTDIFFNALKQTQEYNTDENLKFFTDCGDNIASLKGSWDLGKLIGKLVGNVAVGAEDLINRHLEMIALYNISVILQDKIMDLGEEFLDVLGTASEEEVIEDYILYSQYLIGCRIRGEYCVYSTVAEDAGLLAWFKKGTAEEAKKWYEEKVKKILDIQDNLLKINTIKEIEVTNNMLLGTWEQAKNFDPFRFEFNTDDKVKYYSKDSRESVYMTTYNIDNNILTINFVNLDESGVTPLSFHVKYSEKEGEKIYIEALDEQANVDKLYGLDKLIVGWYSRVEDKSYSEAEKDVINLSEEFSRYLSVLLDSNLNRYSNKNIDYSNLLWVTYYYMYERKGECIIDEGDGYYAVLATDANSFIQEYFNVSVPYETFGDIIYKNSKFYFPGGDYGEIGKTVAIVEDIRYIEENMYEVTFYDTYVYPENWNNGAQNPTENWDIYYRYNVQQMNNDEFIEVEGKGRSIIKKEGDRVILLEYNLSVSEGQYVELTGILDNRGNPILKLDMPLRFYDANGIYEVQEVGVAGVNYELDFNKIYGKRVKLSGEVMRANKGYHWSEIMILEGANTLKVLE